MKKTLFHSTTLVETLNVTISTLLPYFLIGDKTIIYTNSSTYFYIELTLFSKYNQ